MAARGTSCEAIHPGYGFLSERTELAELCERSGIIFIGPTSANIKRMGDKLAAREIARNQVSPCSRLEESGDVEEAVEVGKQLGFPLILKAAAGGGGRGMAIIETAGQLEQVFASLALEVYSAFGDASLFLERYFSIHVTSRYRSSAITSATQSIFSKGTARSSGGTRKSSKKRPAPF